MTFPFQRLPAEIRNNVYKQHLRFPSKTPINKKHLVIDAVGFCNAPDGSARSCRCTPSVLEIRLVCKQFNHEATHIFYRWNHFELYRTQDLFCFLLSLRSNTVLRQNCLSLIQEISICHRGSMAKPALRLLRRAGNLKKLHICIASQTPKGQSVDKTNTLLKLNPLRKLRGVEVDFTLCLSCSRSVQWSHSHNQAWDDILRSLKEKIAKASKGKT